MTPAEKYLHTQCPPIVHIAHTVQVEARKSDAVFDAPSADSLPPLLPTRDLSDQFGSGASLCAQPTCGNLPLVEELILQRWPGSR